MAADRMMDGAALELRCLCSFENFERVVQRKPHNPVITDFVACVGCRAMYFSPMPKPDPPEWQPGHGMGAIGGPQLDSDEKLKRDAATGALDYQKPGRHKPLRGR